MNYLHLLLVTPLFISTPTVAEELINSAVIKGITNLYQGPAKNRLLAWSDLIQKKPGATDIEKLTIVNAYFNKFQYRTDQAQFGKMDFWMTPIEFISKGGGDCEDFAIGKYFTLQAIGVPREKMRITYVKYLVQNVAHMVLTYYPSPGAMPLVLDNLTGKILPADKRTDLKPVYSFNGEGLWQSIQRGQGQRVGGSDRINVWRELNARMERELEGKATG